MAAQFVLPLSASPFMFIGDSITALGWFGPYVASLMTAMSAGSPTGPFTRGGTVGAGSSVPAQSKTNVYPGSLLIRSDGGTCYGPGAVINKGVAGNTVAQVTARLSTDCYPFKPQAIWMNACINNIGQDLTDFQTDCQAFITAIQTNLNGVPLAWSNIFCDDESVPCPNEADIEAYNSVLETVCDSNGVPYIDLHTSQQAWEVANNLPHPGVSSGLLTVDGIHPLPLGETIMGQAALAQTSWLAFPALPSPE